MDRQCPREVETEDPEQEEFALLIDCGPLGEAEIEPSRRQPGRPGREARNTRVGIEWEKTALRFLRSTGGEQES
jgi:hypothetical protein